MNPTDVYTGRLESLRASGNLRRLPEDGDARGVDFSGNDYLGIGADTALQRDFLARQAGAMSPGLTASASRLLAANQAEHRKLEELLESLYGRPALVMNSGYHANVGLIQAFASEPRTAVVADRLVHASIIDGIRLSGCRFERFRHNDYGHLERLVERLESDCDLIWVIAEGVYSMDGDRADIGALLDVKRRHPSVMVYVDEAHSFGVEGEKGLGLTPEAEKKAGGRVDVMVGTLGKAAASAGAFAVMDEGLKAYAVNRARSLIFSTALPPLCCAWSRAVVEKIVGMDAERRHLASLAARLSGRLGGVSDARYIYPFIVGDADRAVRLSAALAREGLKVLPIRTPTVAAGTERLRISLSAAMSETDIDRLADALNRLTATL